MAEDSRVQLFIGGHAPNPLARLIPPPIPSFPHPWILVTCNNALVTYFPGLHPTTYSTDVEQCCHYILLQTKGMYTHNSLPPPTIVAKLFSTAANRSVHMNTSAVPRQVTMYMLTAVSCYGLMLCLAHCCNPQFRSAEQGRDGSSGAVNSASENFYKGFRPALPFTRQPMHSWIQ